MVTITIDGKQISVDENLSILEAAQEADVKIPTLCYLKDVNEVGACKMCVVEVEGSRHLVTSCNTKVKEGMVVNTHSERVVNSRKQVLNMLLANHDIRCFPAANPVTVDCRICPMNMALRNPVIPEVQPNLKRKRKSFPDVLSGAVHQLSEMCQHL